MVITDKRTIFLTSMDWQVSSIDSLESNDGHNKKCDEVIFFLNEKY